MVTTDAAKRTAAEPADEPSVKGRPINPKLVGFVQRTYRFSPELIQEVEAFAAKRKISKQAGFIKLLTIGLHRVAVLDRQTEKRKSGKSKS